MKIIADIEELGVQIKSKFQFVELAWKSSGIHLTCKTCAYRVRGTGIFRLLGNHLKNYLRRRNRVIVPWILFLYLITSANPMIKITKQKKEKKKEIYRDSKRIHWIWVMKGMCDASSNDESMCQSTTKKREKSWIITCDNSSKLSETPLHSNRASGNPLLWRTTIIEVIGEQHIIFLDKSPTLWMGRWSRSYCS